MKTLQSFSSTQKKLRVNVITSQGGGGHYAAYNAIRSVIEQRQLPWEFSVTDMDDIADSLAEQKKVVNAYKIFGFSGHDLYNKMQKSGWAWLWPLKMRLNKLLVKLNYDAGLKYFEEYWREKQPDLVVSVVPLYNKGLWESLQKAKPGTPYVTVIGDFADYPPAFWIEPETDNYTVCGTEKSVEQARSLGVKEERIIKTSGMVINPRFYEPMSCDRYKERERLGLDPECLTGVVLFGGHGSKAMLEIALRLKGLSKKLQLIFLCGYNQELASALRKTQGLNKQFVTTFTTNIPYYMHLADFFIGKPGPGSISEALSMSLPVIVERNRNTLIHERYNTNWIEEKQVGLVLPSFSQIEKAVNSFLDINTFARYQTNVAAVNNQAVFEVADLLENIMATDNNIKAGSLTPNSVETLPAL